MDNVAFKALIDAIRANQFTPSQMEDMVYAMHSAYMDFHESVSNQLPTSLEDVADTMVVARSNTEAFPWEDDEPCSRGGYVHTVPNVEGVSLEVAL